MDFTFNCPHCQQELEVDSSAAGSEVDCPACDRRITVPAPTPEQLQAAPAPAPAPAATGAARSEKHFVVPIRDGPTEALIQKPRPTLELAASEPEKRVRIKTFRRIDTLSVNKDNFDEVVSEFLQKVGQEYIIGIHPITYSYKDLATEHYLTDYGVMVVFRG